MPTNFRDLAAFIGPAETKEIVDYAKEGETDEQRMGRAYDHLDAQLTPRFERALSIDLRLAIDEFLDLMGPRPERTADLEQWQPDFDKHIAAAIGDDTLKLLGEAWSDMCVVNCDLDDAEAFERACRTGADAILDTMLAASSKNKMLSAVGIVPAVFASPEEKMTMAPTTEEDLGDLDEPTEILPPIIAASAIADDLGDLGDDVAVALGEKRPSEKDYTPYERVDVATPSRKRGRPTLATDGMPTNEEALKVLVALREHAKDSDADLASKILACSRSQIGNYAKRVAPFVPTTAQYQQLRDLAQQRGQALLDALRVAGQ